MLFANLRSEVREAPDNRRVLSGIPFAHVLHLKGMELSCGDLDRGCQCGVSGGFFLWDFSSGIFPLMGLLICFLFVVVVVRSGGSFHVGATSR